MSGIREFKQDYFSVQLTTLKGIPEASKVKSQ